ncbi:YunG family protein [Streptomyces griseoloalbus]|uniref:YunG family protein n=1 Tax=Streptomyces griseoloalbus TaxID=67303 RepID=UPI003F53FA25
MSFLNSDGPQTAARPRKAWQPDNPARGHCDITALVVNDLFGGELMGGEVHLDGSRHGYHWWNRLPSGVELDLTREQFRRGQTITAARAVERPPGPLPHRRDQYLHPRERPVPHLGPLPGPACGHSPPHPRAGALRQRAQSPRYGLSYGLTTRCANAPAETPQCRSEHSGDSRKSMRRKGEA